jgi:hypothetical protein
MLARRFHHVMPRARAASRRPGKARTRPGLEPLEERAVPTILVGDPVTDWHIDSNSGAVLKAAKVELVFWGNKWTAADMSGIRKQISTLLTGPYMDSLSQYGGVGPAQLDHTYNITSSSPGGTFTDANVTAMLEGNFQDHSLPLPSTIKGDALYVVIPQPGSTTNGGDDNGLGGRHDTKKDSSYTDPKTHRSSPFNYNYAWTINPSGNFDQLTFIFSHELVEAVTDAGPGYRGYQFGKGGADEIADGFPQQFGYRLDGVYVQSYWSQADHSYVVPTGQSQNFLVSVPADVINSFSTPGRHKPVVWKLVINGDQLKTKSPVGTTTTDDISVGYDPSADQITATLNGETAVFDRTYFPWQNPSKRGGNPTLKEVDINPKKGSNTIDVEGDPANVPVTVNGKGVDDALSVDKTAQNLDNIRAPITFKQNPTTNSMALFDRETTGSQTFSIQPGLVQRGGTTLISFDDKKGSLAIDGSSGAKATFNVMGTRRSTPVTLNGHSGRDLFVLDAPTDHDTHHVRGKVTIDGGAGSTGSEVDVHDEGDRAAGTMWTVSPTGLSRTDATAAPPTLVDYANVATLKLSGAAPKSVYNVTGTAAITATTITQTTGGATFNVGAAGTLAPIVGPLTVVGGAKVDTGHTYALNFNDTASTSPYPPMYEIHDSTFHVQGGALVAYSSMSTLEADGPIPLAAIWHVYSTDPDTPITIGTGAGSGLPTGNLIDIIPTGKDLSLIHKVTIKSLVKGVPSTVDVVNDQSDMTYVATDSELTSAKFPDFDLKYENVALVKIVNDANPADSIKLEDFAKSVVVELITNSSRT